MGTSRKFDLSVELANRVAAVATARGQPVEAFITEAIEARLEREERRREFIASALEAEREVSRDGQVYGGDEALIYLESKLSARPASRPSRRKV